MTPEEKTLFAHLLQQSELFDTKIKQMIQKAIENDVLPEQDAHHLLMTLKMEQNLMAVIDQRAKTL